MIESNNSKTISFKRKLLFSFIIFAFFIMLLCIIEGVVRLTLPFIPSIKFFVTGTNHGDKEESRNVFEGDALLGWRLKPNLDKVYWDFTSFSTNKQNVRYHHDIGKNRADTFRILCFGDSVTFGYRVPVTFRKNINNYDRSAIPYPLLLEKKLDEMCPDVNVEVIPMAVPGYTSFHGLAWLKREIKRLEPDIITINYGYNDTTFLSFEYKNAISTHWFHVMMRNLTSKSQAAIHLSMWYNSLLQKGNQKTPLPKLPGVSTEDYINNILSMVELVGQEGASSIVIGQVYRKPDPRSKKVQLMVKNRQLLALTCKNNNIPYLEINELTEVSYPENKKFFGENIHPNKDGHVLMAKKLLNFLIDNKMITKLCD